MEMSYNQHRRVERAIKKYSLALGYDPAKKYVESIVNSSLTATRKDHIPPDAVLSVVIKELYHHYRKSVAQTNSEAKAIEVLTTLQDRLNIALGQESQL
ncbi:MAG: hypothetical protein NTW67_04200 [Candidatus Woesearchaeota archaeon]|nr:hypothetical protein [Candidatus Woesearchaeota archaeon]